MHDKVLDRDRCDEVLDRDAHAQAAAIRDGELSCSELIEASIRRIESLNAGLNCVVAERFEAALQEARALDERGVWSSPLAGVPVLLKDLGQQVAGLAQTDGSRAERTTSPAEDSLLAARYRQGGLILLGKTTSPEFGNHSTSEPAVHGPARNPWDPERTSGGSSGGTAAAVAARMAPVAGASDGAGSIRIPASCCGVFGLKPSRGRVAVANSEGQLAQVAVTHALSRSVRDSAALLDLVSAPDSGATASPPLPRVPFAMKAGAPGNLRVALSVEHTFGGAVDVECVTAAEHTAELLTSLGHRVEAGAPKFDRSVITGPMLALWAAANLAGKRALEAALGRPLRRDELEETTWELVEHAEHLSDDDIAWAGEQITAAAEDIARFFEHYDLWLTPTLAQAPPALGILNRSVGSAAGWWNYDLEFNPWCPIANVSGGASASLPLHVNAAGLPIGSMLTAGYGQESLLLRVCTQLEEADPWGQRRP